jgi:DNA repair photolyase
MIAPIIPGITDDEKHITEVVMAAKDHGAGFVTPNILYLKPGTKEWFMPALRAAYPHLAGKYERYYRGPYAPKEYSREVIALVNRIRDRAGFPSRRPPSRTPPNTQMALSI